MRNKLFIFVSITLALSSCSSYKETFDCPPCRGIGCESITNINDLVNKDKVKSLRSELILESDGTYRFWMGKHVDSVGSCFDESLDMVKV